jgi:hypothetical protein
MAPASAGVLAHDRLASLFDERSRLVTGSTAETTPVTVLVLLRSFDLTDIVRGAQLFAAGLSEAEGRTWLRSWTRTRFFFGNPQNLPDRAQARIVAPAGTAAWLGPYPSDHLPGVSRLLKPLTGSLPPLPGTLDIPGGPASARRELQLATREVTLVNYLVHLHHTIAEAVLLGRLGAAEPLLVRHRPDLDAGFAHGSPGYARVHYAAADSPVLRLYTSLSP